MTLTPCETDMCAGTYYGGGTNPANATYLYYPAQNQMISSYCLSQYDNCSYPAYNINGTNYWIREGGKDTTTCLNLQTSPPTCTPPTASLTVNTAYGSATNGGSVYTHGYNDTPTLTWSSTNASSCTLTSNNGDWKTGTNGLNVPANSLGNDSGSGHTWTYTLNCTGSGGSANQTATVQIPPSPSNPAATCPAPGNATTLSWTAPSGWNNFYVRNDDLTAGGHVYWNESYAGTTYAIPDSYSGAEYQINPIVNHTYSMWIHTRAPNGAYSVSVGVNYTCQAAVCPAGSVSLSPASPIIVGNTTAASAPASWSGGQFNSSNSGVASVSGSTINGVAAGTVQISGFGWNAPNGATGCGLSNANLTVTGGVCTPSASRNCPGNDSSSCNGTQTCNGTGTAWGTCATNSNSCNNNACITGQTCQNGACQGGSVVSGSHKACNASKQCILVSNTSSACTGSCAVDQDCGACFPLTYKSAYSGFSTNSSGPSGSTLTVTVGGSPFYAFVDYGQASIDSIQAPNSGSNTCTFDAFLAGSSGTSMARFKCTVPGTVNTYSYVTGTNSGTSSNTCASGSQTIGAVTVTPADTCTTGCGTCGGGVCGGGGGAGTTVTAAQAVCNATGVVLSWPPGSGAASYNIYKNTSNSVPGSPISGSPFAAQNGNVGNQSYTDNTAPSTGPYFYWVQSVASGGVTSPDKVAANTNVQPPGAPGISANICVSGSGPATVTLDNSTCNQIGVSWTTLGAGYTYNVYRSQTSTFPGVSGKLNSSPLSFSASPYPDTTAVSGWTYYYWVTGITGGVETNPTQASPPNFPIGAVACTANMGSSDKVVASVNNGTPLSTGVGQCGNSGTLPSGTTLNLGDKLSFRIDLCNNGATSQAPATNIRVVDKLINLATSSTVTTFNVSYHDGSGAHALTQGSSPGYSLSGAAPNQTMTIDLSGYTLPANTGYASLTFDAALAAPAGFSGTSSRFYNIYSIVSSGPTASGQISWPFYTGNSVPTINEVP